MEKAPQSLPVRLGSSQDQAMMAAQNCATHTAGHKTITSTLLLDACFWCGKTVGHTKGHWEQIIVATYESRARSTFQSWALRNWTLNQQADRQRPRTPVTWFPYSGCDAFLRLCKACKLRYRRPLGGGVARHFQKVASDSCRGIRDWFDSLADKRRTAE